jgi:glutathione S-transferase
VNEIREALAALEHDQWASWAADIAATETITPARLDRWHELITSPYSTLTEAQKDQDREWADKVLAILAKHGYGV